MNMTKAFYKHNKFNFVMALIGTFLLVLLNTGIAFIGKEIFDIAAEKNWENFYNLLYVAILFLVLFIIVILLNKHFINNYQRKAIRQYKDIAFEKLLSKSINSFDKEVTGKYISLLTNDITTIETGYIKGTLDIALNICFLVVSLVAMFYLNWIITLGIIVLTFLPILVSTIFGRNLQKYEANTSSENEKFVSFLQDALTGFSVVKSFKVEKEMLQVFLFRNKTLESTRNTKDKAYSLLRGLSGLAIMFIQLGIFFVGAYFTIKGLITIGSILAFVQLIDTVMSPVSELGAQFATRKAAKGLILKMQDAVKTIDSETQKIDKHTMVNGIEFKNVSFKYDENNEILNNINLKFKKGKSYAIVGGSGSGKSTMLNLLFGYYDNYQGQILIDDTDIKTIQSNGLYDILSVVQQNTFIFDTTVKNNITMYKKFDDNLINDAIEKSGLADFVKDKGNEYRCGENGCNLSGGEKQRITIARCLLRNTPIIVMDEGTSALDSKMTQYIEQNILNCNEITRIVVSHKMSEPMLKQYDKIFVLNNHSIVETGTFDQLISEKGYFESLYNVSI